MDGENGKVDGENGKVDRENAKTNRENAKANRENAKANRENAKANRENAKAKAKTNVVDGFSDEEKPKEMEDFDEDEPKVTRRRVSKKRTRKWTVCNKQEGT